LSPHFCRLNVNNVCRSFLNKTFKLSAEKNGLVVIYTNTRGSHA
jgi:hypothetical protein